MDVKINLKIITKNNAADTEIRWGKIFEMNQWSNSKIKLELQEYPFPLFKL